MNTESIQGIEKAMAAADTAAQQQAEPVTALEVVAEVAEPVVDNAHADGDQRQEATGDSANPDGEDAPARQNKGVGKRINELTKQRHEAERRAEEAERQLAEIRRNAAPQQPPAQEAKADDGRPKLEDFAWDVEAHADALVEWKLNKREESAKREKQQEEVKKRTESLEQRANAFADENPDYAEKVERLQLTDAMYAAILETEIEPQIAYHLANNPSEAEAIRQKSPQGQILAIGLLAAKLESKPVPSTPERPAPPVQVPPPPPAPSLSARAPASAPLEKWDMNQHIEAIRAKSRR